MSEDLFGKPNVPTIDPDKDYFAELVGDNAKFKTPQALARGKVESDLHISRLESELNELRTDLAKAKTMQDFLDQLDARANRNVSREPELGNQPANQDNGELPHKSNALSRDDVLGLLRQEQEAERQARNVNAVTQALKDVWGGDYQNELRKAAQEVGVSDKFLEDMAKTNPQAFLKLVGADKPNSANANAKAVFSPLGTQVNTSARPPQVQEKDYAYYENLRKTNPTLYHSPAIQNERWAQAKKLGEKF